MIEKIIVVNETSQEMAKNNNPFLKVSYTDEEGKKYTSSVFDQAMWNILGKGMAVKAQLEKSGNFWNILKAEPVSAEVAKAATERAELVVDPQETGMWYKEIGLNYRAGKLEGATGKALMTAYWARMFIVVGLEKEKPKSPPPEPKELDPDDIPF